MRSTAEVKGRKFRVDKSRYYAVQLYRLEGEEGRNAQDDFVRTAYERQHKQTAHRINEQNVSVVEKKVNQAPNHHQKHSPREARTEVYAFLGSIVMLNEETQSEKQGKNRIHLSCQQIESRIPDGLIERCPKRT